MTAPPVSASTRDSGKRDKAFRELQYGHLPFSVRLTRRAAGHVPLI